MEDNLSYLTIERVSESEHRDRGSKFLAFAYPVDNRDAIKQKLDALWLQYPDATHICYAWQLGDEYRANDDGEPGNSAGMPILRRIHSHGLDHVLVAVVRYYGGKKLGVSGLIDAYGTAAELALSNAKVLREHPKVDLLVRDLQNRDYIVYELQGKHNILDLIPPDHISGYFRLTVYQSYLDEFVNQLESLPNFEVQKPQ